MSERESERRGEVTTEQWCEDVQMEINAERRRSLLWREQTRWCGCLSRDERKDEWQKRPGRRRWRAGNLCFKVLAMKNHFLFLCRNDSERWDMNCSSSFLRSFRPKSVLSLVLPLGGCSCSKKVAHMLLRMGFASKWSVKVTSRLHETEGCFPISSSQCLVWICCFIFRTELTTFDEESELVSVFFSSVTWHDCSCALALINKTNCGWKRWKFTVVKFVLTFSHEMKWKNIFVSGFTKVIILNFDCICYTSLCKAMVVKSQARLWIRWKLNIKNMKKECTMQT